MIRLAAILDEIGGAVFYDLMAHPGFDLQAWFNGGCKSHRPCHVRALVDGLPRHTATQAYLLRGKDEAEDGDEMTEEDKRFFDALGWSSTTDRLLALIHNQLAAANHARGEGEAPPTPESMGWVGPLEWQDAWKARGKKREGTEGAPAGESMKETMARLMGGMM